jgi:hypothetical protein
LPPQNWQSKIGYEASRKIDVIGKRMTRAEASLFFDSYAACFSRGDAEGVLRHWTLPAFISGSGGRSGSFLTADVFLGNVRALCDFYRRRGIVRAEKQILDIQSLYDGVALVRTGDRLHDVSDSIVAEWEHVYVLRRQPEGWRAFLAIADGELAAWKMLGTELGARE